MLARTLGLLDLWLLLAAPLPAQEVPPPLRVDGAAVTRIERNGEQLTLGEAAAAQGAADALALRFRHWLLLSVRARGTPSEQLGSTKFNLTQLGLALLTLLAWVLWLANALIGWLRWAFDAWTRGGYWRKRAPQPGAPPPQLPPSATEPPHA